MTRESGIEEERDRGSDRGGEKKRKRASRDTEGPLGETERERLKVR